MHVVLAFAAGALHAATAGNPTTPIGALETQTLQSLTSAITVQTYRLAACWREARGGSKGPFGSAVQTPPP
jgi:hypothetical protein